MNVTTPPQKKNIRLGDVLVEGEIITERQLESALAIQKSSGGKKLGDILLDLEIITEEQLLTALQKRLNVPIVDLRNLSIPSELFSLVPEKFAKDNLISPVRMHGMSLVIATSDPLNFDVANNLSTAIGRNVETVLALKADIQIVIDRNYGKQTVDVLASSLNIVNDAKNLSFDIGGLDLSNVESRVGSEPIVKFINTLLEQAYVRRASDIHIEPLDHSVRVRFRIDGDLVEITSLNARLQSSMVTRIKIMADMDIAERRVPLDGRFNVVLDESEVSIRVSTMPTVYGEKVVMRILADSKAGILTIPQLGMNERHLEMMYRAIKSPNGIILATGPTGSGKSTTLYSILSELSTVDVNILTVEDPVEKIVPGVNQTQVNPKAGLTFASGLRAILRQDPDKIMIGEIRDTDTADIAARAAITGHLVLASLHTNDAASAFMRLIDMGAEPYIVASSVVAVISQRLVKKICPHCKAEHTPTDAEALFLERNHFILQSAIYAGVGCNRCTYTGTLGRTSIHEFVLTDNNIRQMIIDRVKSTDIEAYLLKEKGQKFLLDNAMELVNEGVISLKEAMTIAFHN